MVSKVETFVKKLGNPFDAWFAFGPFAEESLLKLADVETLPCPLYIIDPDRQDESRNYTFVTPNTLITLPGGLRVMYVRPKDSLSSEIPANNKTLYDIAFVDAWPNGIIKDYHGDQLLAGLLQRIPFRYIFACQEGSFVEREPFETQFGKMITYTRFISLCPTGGEDRWYYAFKIEASLHAPSETIVKRPPKYTASPFLATNTNYFFHSHHDQQPEDTERTEDVPLKRPPQGYKCRICQSSDHFIDDCPSRGQKTASYVCRICQEPGHHIRDCPLRSGKRARTLDASSCWFCMGNQVSKKHLIFSIGEQVYATLARGGLAPDHLLIIPIDHVSGIDPMADTLIKEIESYKNKMTTWLAESNKFPIFFSLRHNPSHHFHIQSIGIPNRLEEKASSKIQKYFEHKGFKLSESIPNSLFYFEIELPGQSLFFMIDKEAFFPMQLGREAVAHLLDLKSDDWKQAILTETEESTLVSHIKKTFPKA